MAAKTRNALFSTFGEATLPPINTNASPVEISEWKKMPEVANCFKKLFEKSSNEKEEELVLARIIKKVFRKKCSNVEMAFVIVICKHILNPKYPKLKLGSKTIKREVRIYLVSFITFLLKISNDIFYLLILFIFLRKNLIMKSRCYLDPKMRAKITVKMKAKVKMKMKAKAKVEVKMKKNNMYFE